LQECCKTSGNYLLKIVDRVSLSEKHFSFFIKDGCMVGSLIIWIAFAAALVSSCLYIFAVPHQKVLLAARTSFYLSGLGVIGVSALLMLFIFQHRFEYNYIMSYSSRDLPSALLVTTFWAGQEGSFLLWAFFATIFGFILQRSSQRKEMEREVMAIYSLILAFLLMLLALKSPFKYVWDAFPTEVQKGFIPQDGKGLNPLLQNFWMIIHPPVLFVGFSSLSVPFVFAVAALWRKQYIDWLKNALPWILFSTFSLGSGLMLGGYWAYGVLGWGGWWGWDPVENSSLLPWIVAVILVHTILIQMLTGKLAKVNFSLAILAFLLVVYSTFLTRSGILANASVHSFVDPGAYAYTLLVLWLGVIILGGFGMLVFRWKDLNIQTPISGWMTRESLLSIATIVMGVCAAIIFFGTSKPIFSSSTVEPSFYDRTTLPLAMLMMFLLGLSLRTKWNLEDHSLFFKRLILPGALSITTLFVLVLLGLHDVLVAAFVFTSLFAFFVAIEQGYRIAKEQPRFLGGSLSHAGLAILFLGIIASGHYGQKQSVSLPLNQPKVVFGDTLTYVGSTTPNDGKTKFIVRIVRNGKQDFLAPVMYESSSTNGIMKTPDYISSLTNDSYIEPVSLEEGGAGEQENAIDLLKDEPVPYGPIMITFKKFDLSSHENGGMKTDVDGGISIGAILEVTTEKGVQTLIPATTYYPKRQPEMKIAYLKNSSIGVQLVSMNVATTNGGKSRVHINIVGLGGMSHGAQQAPEILVADVSIKPFMSFVWIASLMIISGLIIAMFRRLKQNNT
jgi:cytochrome c-type biogenesis protein CcmF